MSTFETTYVYMCMCGYLIKNISVDMFDHSYVTGDAVDEKTD